MIRKKTPIVILAFNRPELVRRLLDRIKKWEPDSLWVVVDGPRNEAEAGLVDQVKACFDGIDWCSVVQKDYASENMGCRRRVTSGLDWFFASNEQGIILEDDCLPMDSLFPYCEELLERYKDDQRVTSIHCTHRLPFNPSMKESYYFSSYYTPDGWASWARAWQHYSDDVSDVKKVVSRMNLSFRARWYWVRMFGLVASGKRDSWGYRWMLTNWRLGRLSVFPRVPLIENVGYGEAATHTRQTSYRLMPAGDLSFPLVHPEAVRENKGLDRQLEDCCYSRSFSQRILWLLRRYFKIEI